MPPKAKEDKKEDKKDDKKGAPKSDKKDDKKAAPTRGGARGGGRGAGRDGRGAGRGDDEFGRGRGRGRGRRPRGDKKDGDKKDWVPCTKLGRLVAAGKINSLEEIFLFSMPIKESQIVDHFLGDALKDEVMKIGPVQKQSAAGQRTRFKAYILVGDHNGHLGLGVKCAKEVATAIRGAIILAKLNVIPIRRGYWGGRFGDPHTVPCKVTGKCGSVRFRVIPAPRGTGLVAAKASKKVLDYAGIKDCYTHTRGQSRTLGNFIHAVYNALVHTYSYLTPDLWPETQFQKPPFQQHTDFLKEAPKKGGAAKEAAGARS